MVVMKCVQSFTWPANDGVTVYNLPAGDLTVESLKAVAGRRQRRPKREKEGEREGERERERQRVRQRRNMV